MEMFYSSAQLKAQRGVDGNSFKKRLQYHLKHQKLTKIRKGLYAETKRLPFVTQEDRKQAGNLIYTPSYLSFETVLAEAGMVFQYDARLSFAGPYTKDVMLQEWDQIIVFRRLPPILLTEPLGLIHKSTYVQACPERAVCDMMLYDPHRPLEGIDHLDKDLLLRISALYGKYHPRVLDRLLSVIHGRYAGSKSNA